MPLALQTRATRARVLWSSSLLALASSQLACESPVASDVPTAIDGGDAGAPAAPLDSGAADGGCTLPASFGSRKCNECVAETCCAPLGECSADATCHALMTCILGCIDEVDAGACASECLGRFPDPDAGERWRALERCAGFTDPCRFHCATKL